MKQDIIVNSCLTDKGWWGTIADNRVPPRGTVGEPRQTLSPNTSMVINRTNEMPAASKPFDRPRDPVVTAEHDTFKTKQNNRGTRPNESRFRRIENIRFKRTESRRIYTMTRE